MRLTLASIALSVGLPAVTVGCPYFSSLRRKLGEGDDAGDAASRQERALNDVISTGYAWPVPAPTPASTGEVGTETFHPETPGGGGGGETGGESGIGGDSGAFRPTEDCVSGPGHFCYTTLFPNLQGTSFDYMDLVQTSIPLNEADGTPPYMLSDVGNIVLSSGEVSTPNGPRTAEVMDEVLTSVPQGVPAQAQLEGESVGTAANPPMGPAGYTYGGQLLSHDLNMDVQTLLGEEVSPDKVHNGENSMADLSTVYGTNDNGGRDNRGVPIFENGRFQFGGESNASGEQCDYVRFEDDGTATIPDQRNDNNKVIAAIQLALMKTHNKLMDLHEQEGFSTDQAFEAVKLEMQRNWQSAVWGDMMSHLCDQDVLESIKSGNTFLYTPQSQAYKDKAMPVEFATCAYRSFHSRLANGYEMGPGPGFRNVFSTDPDEFTLQGGSSYDSELLTNAFEVGRFVLSADPNARPNGAHPVDLLYSQSLMSMPTKTSGNPPAHTQIMCDEEQCTDDCSGGQCIIVDDIVNDMDEKFASMALLDLVRAQTVKVAGGRAIAEAAQQLGAGNIVYSMEALGNTAYGEAAAFEGANDVPCMMYILYEAVIEQQGVVLGTLGSRIVAEFVHGAIENTPDNFLEDLSWTSVMSGKREVKLYDIFFSSGSTCFNTSDTFADDFVPVIPPSPQSSVIPPSPPPGGWTKTRPPMKKKKSKTDTGCAEMFCDELFKKANYYHRQENPIYGGASRYYFTRQDCAWDPSPYYHDDDTCRAPNNVYEVAACDCYWDYELQCETAMMKNEAEFELATEINNAIESGSLYASKYAYDTCFADEIYGCLCSFDEE